MSSIESWNPKAEDTYSDPVRDALEYLNSLKQEAVLDSLPAVRRSEEGVQYAVFADQEVPEVYEEALFVYNAFAQPIDPSRPLGISNLLRGRYIQEVMRQAEIKNQRGDTLPVVMFAAPHLGHDMGLGHQDRSELSYANFLPLADRYARALPGIGRIAIVGHSLGANVAVLRSDALDNKDVIAVGAADPLNVRRPPFDLFKRHTASNPGDDYRESGYKPILRVHQLDEESSDSTRLVERAVRDVKGVADKLTLASLSISRGLTRPLFNQRLEQSVASKPATHFMIGAGEKSLITDESIRDTVARMQADHPNTRLDLVTIAGRGHGWAEDARLFGEFTLRTITGTHFR